MGLAHFIRPTVIGEFVDEAKPGNGETKPSESATFLRALVIAEFEDNYVAPKEVLPLRDFVILLADNKVVQVRGHFIEVGADTARDIIRYVGNDKVRVATFNWTKVIGIYEGDKLPA